MQLFLAGTAENKSLCVVHQHSKGKTKMFYYSLNTLCIVLLTGSHTEARCPVMDYRSYQNTKIR